MSRVNTHRPLLHGSSLLLVPFSLATDIQLPDYFNNYFMFINEKEKMPNHKVSRFAFSVMGMLLMARTVASLFHRTAAFSRGFSAGKIATVRQKQLVSTLTTSTELNVKYKTFDEMLEHHSDVPLLIDFYAPWCGPCKVSACNGQI